MNKKFCIYRKHRYLKVNVFLSHSKFHTTVRENSRNSLKKKKKEREKGSRDLPKKYSPNVLQILPEAKVPYTLTGSGFPDKEGRSSDSVVQWSPR